MRIIIRVAGLFALAGCAAPFPFTTVMLVYTDSMN